MCTGDKCRSKALAMAQLRGDKLFMSRLTKRLKAPHAGRKANADLRYLHRVLAETGALESLSGEQLVQLVGIVSDSMSHQEATQ